jgi:hypothetical protein
MVTRSEGKRITSLACFGYSCKQSEINTSLQTITIDITNLEVQLSYTDELVSCNIRVDRYPRAMLHETRILSSNAPLYGVGYCKLGVGCMKRAYRAPMQGLLEQASPNLVKRASCDVKRSSTSTSVVYIII